MGCCRSVRRLLREPSHPVAWWAWVCGLGFVVSVACASMLLGLALLRTDRLLKSSDADPVKDVLITMLSCAQPIFVKHNVSLFLSFGSLLGARREGDFIKGDVPLDVDIGVVSCDEARLKALAPEFQRTCDFTLLHRDDPQYTSFGAWAIHKTAFRLYWRRFVPIYLDFQQYEVFTDRKDAATVREVAAAKRSTHGCGTLAASGSIVAVSPQRRLRGSGVGQSVPPSPRGLDWSLDNPHLKFVSCRAATCVRGVATPPR